MNQDLGKKPGSTSSAMTRSELQEDRVYTLHRLQWKGSLDTGSDFSSTGPEGDDTHANPGPVSNRYSAQYRGRCPEISDKKCSTQLKCAAFEDEYQRLPSPARFSQLRKRSPSRSKEGMRVTFAQDCPDAYSLKETSSSQTEAPPSSVTERPEAWRSSPYLGRGRPQWGSLTGHEALAEGPGGRGNVSGVQPCPDLCPCCTDPQLPFTQPQTAAPDPETELDLDPDLRSLLKGTSGVNRRTPGLSPDSLCGAARPREEVSRFRRVLEVSHCWGSVHRSASPDRLPDGQSPGTQGSSLGPASQSPPSSLSGLERKDLQSLSSALCPAVVSDVRNNPARGREDFSLRLRAGEYPTRTPPAPISELSTVLRQLLDLVDQHWTSPHSLQTNSRFLTPAYDLLASLASPSPGQLQRGRGPRRVDKNGDDDAGGIKDGPAQGLNNPNPKLQKNQLHTQTQLHTESPKKRVATAMEERNGSHCQIVNSKPNSALNIFESGRQWDQCLQRQVEALREQERHFKQLEETMGLLQDSHRLLSSNNSLMEQLNSTSSTQHTDTRKCVSHLDFRQAASGLSLSSKHLT